MLTRLRNVASGDMLTVANIHVAYDKFERQDRQCLQVVCLSVCLSENEALYRILYTSSGKHEFACISTAAVHVHTSTGYL